MSDDGTKLAAVVKGGHIYTFSDSEANWTDRSGTGSAIVGDKHWYSIAMSDDGQELAAVVGGASGDGRHLYTATNSGADWTNRSTAAGSVSVIGGNRNWISIAMSGNGEKLAAVVFGGHIYTSSDSGDSWTDRSTGTISGAKYWYSIAMSDNGERLAAVVFDGHIYTSSNSGAAWVDRSRAPSIGAP